MAEFCLYASKCKPRRLNADGEVKPILIFTDASWESQVGGLGALVVATAAGDQVTIFSGQMVDALKSRWLKEVCEHLICQLELYVMVT